MPNKGNGMMQAMRLSVLCRLLIPVFILSGLCQADPAPRVLLLFSNDRLLPANQRYDEGIRRALDPQG
jgi:hypothetical protein